MKATPSTVRLRILAAVAACLALAPLAAQEGEVFAPYPSRIRVGTRGPEVVVTWEDSADVKGGYVVYRSLALPDQSSFPSAVLLGYADSGEAGFSYIPPDGREYYYFVLGRSADASAADPAVYELFIPLRNVSLAPVAAGEPASAAVVSAPAQAAPSLSGILAVNSGDAIVVSFDAAGDTGRLVVYRGTAAIKDSKSILDASVAAVLDKGAGPFRDYPVPGIEYYYAVVPERELMGGRIAIVPGANATTRGASVPAGSYRVGLPSMGAASRSMPLPYLVMTRGLSDARPVSADEPTPDARPLSAETEKAIAAVTSAHGSASRAPRPPLTIFPEDLQTTGGGEEYALRMIVGAYLAKGRYADAVEQFSLYLSLPRSRANADRARFYLGQAEAMDGSFREAFFDLLQVQDGYYLACAEWIDYVLDQLRS